MVCNIVRNTALRYPESLRLLSDRTKHCKCLDPRDRVFALVSLMSGKTEHIKPNYAKSIRQVYQEAALYDIKRSESLNILGLCNINAEQPNWPTWVPNFDVAGLASFISLSNASGASAPKMQLINERNLEVTGIHLATVRLVETLMLADTSIEDVIVSIQRVVSQNDLENASYIGGGSTFDAYYRTLLCGWPTEQTLFGDWGLSFEKSREALRNALLCEVPNDPCLSLFIHYIRGSICGRRLFTTEEGYVGLASEAAKPQDQVCILLGCETPMFLRSTENGQYQVVGEGYVQGVMDAEALLGPYPEYWRKAWDRDDHGDGIQMYRDTHTRETTKHDPRLGPIPDEWQTLSHDKEKYFNLWLNVETEERTYRDPRMRPEALRKRGVNLRTFDLV